MELKRIWIHRDHHGKFKGDLQVDLEEGEIELKLNEDEVDHILRVCADSLVRISEAAAARIRDAIRRATDGVQRGADNVAP